MSYTFASISAEVAALMNDAAQTEYTTAVMLPFAKMACDELQLELELNGVLALETISAAITVPALTTDLGILIPADMLEPQRLEERLDGSTDLYTPMVRRMWTPDLNQTDSLRYWDYREQNIFFVGATQDREIKIYYLKSACVIVDESTAITINGSGPFIKYRTAALCANFIGENPERAAELNGSAQVMLNKVIRIAAKSKQGTRTRRRPFRISGSRRFG